MIQQTKWTFREVIKDFQSLLALVAVVMGFAIVLVALVLGVVYPGATQTTGVALQTGSTVVLAVLAFYFGRTGVEQERSRADLATSKANAAEANEEKAVHEVEKAQKETARSNKEVLEKESVLQAMTLASDAMKDHYADRYAEAEAKYLLALKHEPSGKERIQILTNLAFVLLNMETPAYKRVAQYLQEADEILRKEDEPDEFWEGLIRFGLGLAQANLGDDSQAARYLNALGMGLKTYDYLFQDGNLRAEQLEPLLKGASELSPTVRSILNEGAKLARSLPAKAPGSH